MGSVPGSRRRAALPPDPWEGLFELAALVAAPGKRGGARPAGA
jgi:DNA polymerase-3 subunit delta